jgi:hypothetical protein
MREAFSPLGLRSGSWRLAAAPMTAAHRRREIHLGDIKNGSTQSSTSYFEQIRADFDLFREPFVYTPGDNEWTDCHRTNNDAYWPSVCSFTSSRASTTRCARRPDAGAALPSGATAG